MFIKFNKKRKTINKKVKLKNFSTFFNFSARKFRNDSNLIKQEIKIKKIPNLGIFFIVALLILIGIVMIFSSSALIAYRYNDGDTLFYVKRQILWITIGIIAGYIIYKINVKYYVFIGKIMFMFSLFGLIWLLPEALSPTLADGSKLIEWPLVKTLNGATRWIDFTYFDIQPAELIKIPLILILSAWLSVSDKQIAENLKKIQKIKDTKSLKYVIKYILIRWYPIILLMFILALIVLQKELDSIVIIFIAASSIMILSKKFSKSVAILSIVGVLSVFSLITLTPYRNARLTAYTQILLNGQPDETVRRAEGFQIWQVLTAIGSGGLLGTGFNESKIKLFFLQEAAYTDSIFAIIGEEFGFIGILIIVLLFLFFAKIGFKIALQTQDLFQKYYVIGCTSLITGQAFLNIAANLSIIPFGGMPLPFISYGGSTTVILIIGVSMILGISKKEVKTIK